MTHVCGGPEPRNPERGYRTAEELSTARDLCAAGGLTPAMTWEPFLHSSPVDAADRPAILLGESPDRDRDIECFQRHIATCAAVGVRAVKYNLTRLGVPRTACVGQRVTDEVVKAFIRRRLAETPGASWSGLHREFRDGGWPVSTPGSPGYSAPSANSGAETPARPLSRADQRTDRAALPSGDPPPCHPSRAGRGPPALPVHPHRRVTCPHSWIQIGS